MNNHIQFQVKIPINKIIVLEETLADLVESMWWDEKGNITGIITEKNKASFQELIKSFFNASNLDTPNLQFSEMDTRDWLQDDQQQLQPIEVANFFLYPPHYHGEIPKEMQPFKIDSPHAFGSGHHETTKSCLIALNELSKQINISKALDVGCGSGILAMAIAFLWKVPVFATDCDQKSVISSKQNIQDNGLQDIQVIECHGLNHEIISKAAPFDLIVANIHSEPLKELASTIKESLSLNGNVLLSGILKEQESSVINCYEMQGMSLAKSYSEGQWSTLLFSANQ